MQLEYFWIKSYRNIENEEFNMGGKYIYAASKDHEGKRRISRKENPNFIKNFFSLNETGFTNVTAIVGVNGSGKSNTLNFIRGIISNKFIPRYESPVYLEFVGIFSNGANETIVLKNLSESTFDLEFKHVIIDKIPDILQTIYFHPSYDFSIFPLMGYADDIDVSGNYLLEEDYENQKSALSGINQSDIHKYSESSRQIEFINEVNLESAISEKINLPGYIDIVIEYNPLHEGQKDFWNTPYSFRSFFKLLDNKHEEEINSLAHREGKFLKRSQSKNALDIDSEMFILQSLYYLLRNLFSNLERTNHYLDQGVVKIEEDTLNQKSFRNSLIDFINHQNLFPKESVINLIENIEGVGSFLKNIESYPDHRKTAKVNIDRISELQKSYLKYQESIYNISGNHLPDGFMNFDWHGLSTGEKAYLNLFSRLYYSKRKIYNRLNDSKKSSPTKQFPETLILLLDEAEIGFHLQWQKEYIKNLIEIVPLLFQPENPNIQLIFTTHSPISLSDIPKSNVIYLNKNSDRGKVLNEKESPKHSFGANIHDLLHDAFYLDNGFMGDFADLKIQKAIDWCLKIKSRRGALGIQKLISMIDEPIIKVKLSEMFADKMGENIERARLEAQKQYIENRIKELDNDSN